MTQMRKISKLPRSQLVNPLRLLNQNNRKQNCSWIVKKTIVMMDSNPLKNQHHKPSLWLRKLYHKNNSHSQNHNLRVRIFLETMKRNLKKKIWNSRPIRARKKNKRLLVNHRSQLLRWYLMLQLHKLKKLHQSKRKRQLNLWILEMMTAKKILSQVQKNNLLLNLLLHWSPLNPNSLIHQQSNHSLQLKKERLKT